MDGELCNMRARIRPSRFRNRLGLRTITAVPNLGLLRIQEKVDPLSLCQSSHQGYRIYQESCTLHTIHQHPIVPFLRDRTFDVEPTTPLINESRHAATIAAEVSAAARLHKHLKNFGGCESQRSPSSEVDILLMLS